MKIVIPLTLLSIFALVQQRSLRREAAPMAAVPATVRATAG
ncbi:hypothetical protein [Accumulibacter sp.]|nr:hypothetical protein [Accumulibacter sp.]